MISETPMSFKLTSGKNYIDNRFEPLLVQLHDLTEYNAPLKSGHQLSPAHVCEKPKPSVVSLPEADEGSQSRPLASTGSTWPAMVISASSRFINFG